MLAKADKSLLEAVLSFTGDRLDYVEDGITRALVGIHDRARRIYLRHELRRIAKNKIRRAVKKAKEKISEAVI